MLTEFGQVVKAAQTPADWLRDHRARMKQYARTRFSWDRVGLQWDLVFRRVLARKSCGHTIQPEPLWELSPSANPDTCEGQCSIVGGGWRENEGQLAEELSIDTLAPFAEVESGPDAF